MSHQWLLTIKGIIGNIYMKHQFKNGKYLYFTFNVLKNADSCAIKRNKIQLDCHFVKDN